MRMVQRGKEQFQSLKSEAEIAYEDADTLTEYGEERVDQVRGFELLTGALYDLRARGGARFFDDVRRELTNVLKETDAPDYSTEASRQALLHRAVERATQPDSQAVKKERADEFIEELIDISAYDFPESLEDKMKEHLKFGEYWKHSKERLQNDFDSRLAEWIRRDVLTKEHLKAGGQDNAAETERKAA